MITMSSYTPAEEYELWKEEHSQSESESETLTEEEEEAIEQLEDFIRSLPDDVQAMLKEK